MSVTIIDVSDSLTSRDFADVRIGWKRFNPDDRRSATRDGIAIKISLRMMVAERHLSTAYAEALVAPAARRLDRRRPGGDSREGASEPLAVQPARRWRYNAAPEELVATNGVRRNDRHVVS
jgi:hypothetical protein